MKKNVSLLLVVLGLALIAAYFIKKRPGTQRPRGAELAPAETIFFAHLSDVQRTTERFRQTELSKLWNEPEVQAFLEKPRAQAPNNAQMERQIERLKRLKVGEGFVAVASIDGPTPIMVGGFSYAGSRTEVEAMLEEAHVEMRRTRPAVKADLVPYGPHEIATFTEGEFTVAEAYVENWVFISNERALLERTLDRYDGKGEPAAQTLARDENFRQSLEPLPGDRDALVFAQLGTLMDRLLALMAATGQKPDAKQIEELKKAKAVAAATKLDGPRFRDTMFVLSPGAAKAPALARHSLALSSTATLLYYAAAMPATLEIPETTMAPLAMLVPGFVNLQKALSDKSLTLADIPKAFGPELSTLLEWPKTAMQPALIAALDVRDQAKAQAFLEVITGGQLGQPAWVRKEQDGVVFYTVPQQGLVLVAPTLALSEKFLVLGLSADAVSGALTRLKDGTARLNTSSAYTAAEGTVSAPTSSYGYLDLRGVFERAYGTFRPFLAMTLAFSPDAAKYIDVAKLPSTETISKHLGTIVYSQSASERGVLVESTGTLTFNQALVGVIAGGVAAAMPTLKNLSGAGGIDPAKLFAPPTQAPTRGQQSPPLLEATPPVSPTDPTAQPAPPASAVDPAPDGVAPSPTTPPAPGPAAPQPPSPAPPPPSEPEPA